MVGTLAKSTSDLKTSMEVLINSSGSKLDFAIPNIPFSNDTYKNTLSKKLRIGVIEDNPLLPVSLSVKRALQLAKDALTA